MVWLELERGKGSLTTPRRKIVFFAERYEEFKEILVDAQHIKDINTNSKKN